MSTYDKYVYTQEQVLVTAARSKCEEQTEYHGSTFMGNVFSQARYYNGECSNYL